MSTALLLLNPTIADIDGSRSVESVLIQDGQIAAIGAPPADLEVETVDCSGLTLAPGLIDAHVHLALTPSGAHIQPSPEEELALWRHHLGAYLANGVTTVLDTGIPLEAAQRMLPLAQTSPSPDIHLLGPLVSPEGGYVSVVLPQFPGYTSAEQVEAAIAAFAPFEPLGVKITVESGMLTEVWPLYSEPVRQALIDSGRPLYAHAISNEEANQALDMGVSGLVHPPTKPNKATVARLVDMGIPVISTISVFDHMLWASEPERFEDPDLAWMIPAAELEAAQDLDWRKESAHLIAQGVLPHSGAVVHNWTARSFGLKRMLRGQTRTALDSVATLHQAGVPIVLGSDSGNWPVFLYEFHGVTTQREVELLTQAGLDPAELMAAATWNPAQMLGIDDHVGRIAPGYRADLLLLEADPLQDPAAWGQIQGVMRAGELHSPREWVELATLE